MTGQSTTPLLDTVDIPADIRRLKQDQLRQLADRWPALVTDFFSKRNDGAFFCLPVNFGQ